MVVNELADDVKGIRLLPAKRSPENSQNFLPDFCGIRVVFAVVILAELCAFLLAFAPLSMTYQQRWQTLGITSLFVQWLGLTSCAILCLSKRWLNQMNDRNAAIASFALTLFMITLISEAAYWVFLKPAPEFVSHGYFLLRNLFIGAIIAGPVLRYFYVQHQWRLQVQAESSARLQALQARIRPHFLFNSMNTIASLTRSQPEQAETAVENLADLFRASMNDTRLHRWQDEQLLCKRYLEIEAMRLGDRLNTDWQVEQIPADALLPPLVIQPLLENAIYYGIEPLAEGGVITIIGKRDKDLLSISVQNPLATHDNHHHRGNHLALENIRERIATLFGPTGTLQLKQHAHSYTVTLSFPYRGRHEDFDR